MCSNCHLLRVTREKGMLCQQHIIRSCSSPEEGKIEDWACGFIVTCCLFHNLAETRSHHQHQYESIKRESKIKREGKELLERPLSPPHSDPLPTHSGCGNPSSIVPLRICPSRLRSCFKLLYVTLPTTYVQWKWLQGAHSELFGVLE